MDNQTKIEYLPGIGKYYAFKLKKLGLETLEDLIYHFPFRWDDFSQINTIDEIREPGIKTSIQGTVWQIKNIRTRFGKFITTATVADQTGTINVIWFNQPYLTKNIKAGTQISLSGKVEQEGKHYKMLSPQYEILRIVDSQSSIDNSQTIHTGRLVPIYPETEGITSKWLRAKIAKLLPIYQKSQEDFLPQHVVERQKLIDLNSALSKIHFPENYDQVQEAKKRLSFDELFILQFASQSRKLKWQSTKKAPKLKVDKEKIVGFVKKLPFTLTGAQTRAVKEILKDLTQETPANRLLEGDVGSGKTVVAAAAIFVAYQNGYEVQIAAPTEILAFQHQKTLQEIFKPFKIEVGIWTGSRKNAAQITCGTHALLSTFTPKGEVGLVIVDEQHRFGVAQRAKMFMTHHSSLVPHLLTMTATPIPRTLALTLYGDLDLSVLDEMPKGRKKISTFVVPNIKRRDAYKFIEGQVISGRQAFILTPFVEPSETMATVKSALVEFEKLKLVFSHHSVILSEAKNLKPNKNRSFALRAQDDKISKIKLALLHGRLKSKEKEKVINDFKAGKTDILVTTPVVEVGIDVPNATIMMVESAERFGLAQLHQLRGRVGRGEHKSYCLLFSDSNSQNSTSRLKSMEKVHVGFELAQIDLKMRGPGEIFGLKQSGFTNLKIADLSDDVLIAKAQQEAKNLLEADPELKKQPLLAKKIQKLQLEYVQPN